jgi:hypothetical protein
LTVCLSLVSMERKHSDSGPLGSFKPSNELDTEVVVHAMDNAESQALAVRKISRTQKLEKIEYAASELADVLPKRTIKSGHAKYWDQLAVDIVSMEEKDHIETRRYDKVVVRCMTCSGKHDTTTINVANLYAHTADHTA